MSEEQDRVVRKPVNAKPGLKVNRGINFSCFVKFEITHTQNWRAKNIYENSLLKSYKNDIKILANPGLA